MKQHGFTIVEIIIVLIVVGILATVGGLAWHKAQENATDSQVKSDTILIRDAIERFYDDNGEYPKGSCRVNTSWVSCTVAELKPSLVPKYLPQLPTEGRGYRYRYVADFSQLNPGKPDRYAVHVKLSSGSCKIGKNIYAPWYNNAPACDF